MIVIGGAGLTGLALGRALERAGQPFVILEAAAEAGGVIRSGRVGPHVLEWGPQRGRLTPPFRALVRELGLEPELVVAPAGLPLLIYRRGRLRRVPLSLGQALRSDLFTHAARLRLLLEPFTRAAAPDETAASCFRRRFGRAAYEDLLGPLFGGLYASDPEHMLVRHALMPVLRQLGAERSGLLALARHALRTSADATPACSFRDGMQTLPRAMYETVESHVRLGETIVALRRRADGGIDVVTDRAVHHASRLVLTLPADSTAALLRPLDAAAADRLAALRYNRFAVVHLHSAAALHGMGYQVSFAEPLATRGVTFNHALFGREGLYTAFLGGARDPAFLENDDEAIGRVAAREFQAVTGHEAGVIAVERVRIPAWDRSWTALDGFTPPPGILLCANYESRAGIPGRLARAAQVAAQLVASETGAATGA
jgi:protoporphyrinogen/coproporphyrinogen III oxidase